MELLSIILYYPFLNLLTFFIWVVPGHYAAVGILLLTLLIRFLLIIPSRKAAQGQRRMTQLNPLMEELKVEYGDDKQALAAAQMELYRKNGVNPFSNCGLVLLQFPLLYVLYYTILHGLTPNNPHLYSWVPRPEFINSSFFGIDLLKSDPTFILPILAALLQFVQVKMTLPAKTNNPDAPVDPAVAIQRNTMFILPLFTLFIAQKFPAGVALYWVITTLFTVVQQYYVNKEKLSLKGVDKVVEKVEKEHPEFKEKMEKVKKEVVGKEEKKGGVTVTVRKKSK